MANGPGMTGLKHDGTWNDGASLQCRGKSSLYVYLLIYFKDFVWAYASRVQFLTLLGV